MYLTQVSTMRKDYERLQKKYNKHAKEVQRDKHKVSQDASDSSAEIARLTNKMEVRRNKKFLRWTSRRYR